MNDLKLVWFDHIRKKYVSFNLSESIFFAFSKHVTVPLELDMLLPKTLSCCTLSGDVDVIGDVYVIGDVVFISEVDVIVIGDDTFIDDVVFTEVEFVHAVSAGGSVKFLPAV